MEEAAGVWNALLGAAYVDSRTASVPAVFIMVALTCLFLCFTPSMFFEWERHGDWVLACMLMSQCGLRGRAWAAGAAAPPGGGGSEFEILPYFYVAPSRLRRRIAGVELALSLSQHCIA